jgi:hypothetical protein
VSNHLSHKKATCDANPSERHGGNIGLALREESSLVRTWIAGAIEGIIEALRPPRGASCRAGLDRCSPKRGPAGKKHLPDLCPRAAPTLRSPFTGGETWNERAHGTIVAARNMARARGIPLFPCTIDENFVYLRRSSPAFQLRERSPAPVFQQSTSHNEVGLFSLLAIGQVLTPFFSPRGDA